MTTDRQPQETENEEEQVDQGSPQRDGGNATEQNVEENHQTVGSSTDSTEKENTTKDEVYDLLRDEYGSNLSPSYIQNMIQQMRQMNLGQNLQNDGPTRDVLPSVVYRTSFKVTHLNELTKPTVERFLQEFKTAYRRDTTILAADYIFEEARVMICSKTDINDNDEVLLYLNDYLQKITAFGRKQPILLIKDKLRWPAAVDLTLEEKVEKFFNKLTALMQEAGDAANTPSIRKKIVKLAIKKLPVAFFIDKEDLDLEPELYYISKLRRRCVERIGVVRKQQGMKSTTIKEKRVSVSTSRVHEQDYEYEEAKYLGKPNVRNQAQQVRQNWQQLFQPPQKPQRDIPPQRYAQPRQHNAQNDPRPQQTRVKKCWNCDQPGHHWTYCTVPLDVEKVKQAKDQFEQMKKDNNRVCFANNFSKQHCDNMKPEKAQKAPVPADNGGQLSANEATKNGLVHRLKSGGNQGYQEMAIEVYSETHAQFITVDGVLDSGTRLNVASMSLFKYCVEELQLIQEKLFSTPTGQVISAEKYGILRLRLRTPQGQLSLGRCRVFFMGGTWRELLIGDNTLKHFGISPKTAVIEKIQDAQKKGSDK